MQRSSSLLRDCSSTAERAVKNELPAANLEPHYRPKANAVGLSLGRLAQRDEVANAVVFLASDLSSVTTGAVLQPAAPVEPRKSSRKGRLVCVSGHVE